MRQRRKRCGTMQRWSEMKSRKQTHEVGRRRRRRREMRRKRSQRHETRRRRQKRRRGNMCREVGNNEEDDVEKRGNHKWERANIIRTH